jgi:hypothetical protein
VVDDRVCPSNRTGRPVLVADTDTFSSPFETVIFAVVCS